MATNTNLKTTAATKPTIDVQAALDEAQLLLFKDRRRAHATLFGGAHRKSHATPEFHWEMIDDWHSPIRKLLQIGFRGSAKTTIGEEGVTINAAFREFRYCLIVSSVSDIAEMRLHAVKRQFEANESILEIFGNLKSRPWEDDQIELSTGVVFRAVGRGQAIRGGKDEDTRPDFIWLDDVEDFKAVANEKQIKKTLEWFDGELLGSADEPNLKLRMTANDMGPDCLANKLKVSWTCRVYPWVKNGKAVWEERYPLASCLVKKSEMYARGSGNEYEREYMCNSARPEAQTFRDEFLKTETRVRLFEPVHAMLIPAPMSASALEVSPCAAAVWSWIGDKCIVWECWSRNLPTHEIASEAERIDAEYRPVKFGVEKSAYETWAHSQLKGPAIVPIKTATDELDFIRAMQPFFVGKQIVFACDPAPVWGQFLSFPNGPKNAAHALAFALHPKMRGGAPGYEDFTPSNIVPDLWPEPGPMMLGLNADETFVCGVMCQVEGRGLRVFADWMTRHPTPEAARDIVQSACVLAQRHCKIIVAPDAVKHPVVGALRKMGLQIGEGAPLDEGQHEMRRLLREQSKGMPRVLVSTAARWTANGLLGGYTLGDEDGPHKLAVEALETVVSLSSLGAFGDGWTNATSRDGRQYFSARPQVRQDA